MNKNLILKSQANRRALVFAVVGLAIGAVVGYYVGRWALNREWSRVSEIVSDKQHKLSSVEGAEPTPAIGVRVLRPLPLRKARAALETITASDPLVLTVGSVGRSGDDIDLHVTLKNRGSCKITGYEGVAYGYDAWGRPSKLNKAGEHYVALHGKDREIEPGKSSQEEMALHNVDNASLALVHIDKVTCADGPGWSRN